MKSPNYSDYKSGEIGLSNSACLYCHQNKIVSTSYKLYTMQECEGELMDRKLNKCTENSTQSLHRFIVKDKKQNNVILNLRGKVYRSFVM